jgi:hypothetical protein
VSAELGSLVAGLPSFTDQPTGSGIPGIVAALAREWGGQPNLGDAVGRTKSTVSYWSTGQSIPDLFASLRLCAVGRLDLVEFLRGAAVETDVEPPREMVRRGEHHRVDWPRIGLLLRGELARETDSPPGLLTILDSLGVDPADTRERYPALCRELVARRLAWRRQDQLDRHAYCPT